MISEVLIRLWLGPDEVADIASHIRQALESHDR